MPILSEISYEEVSIFVFWINTYIDILHGYFPILSLLAGWSLLEVFLPPKNKFYSAFDKYFHYLKFALISFLAIIIFTQGLFGGCIIHIPQNLSARFFLGRNWTEYGLFYRQNIPESLHFLLRLFYFILGPMFIYFTYEYYQKRILHKEPENIFIKSYLQLKKNSRHFISKSDRKNFN